MSQISLKKRFQLKFKDRTFAANILAAALEDFLGKEYNECETTIDRAFHYENKKTEKSESFRYRLWLHGSIGR
jgi:hypothetical protein